jgi:hypothetical protein
VQSLTAFSIAGRAYLPHLGPQIWHLAAGTRGPAKTVWTTSAGQAATMQHGPRENRLASRTSGKYGCPCLQFRPPLPASAKVWPWWPLAWQGTVALERAVPVHNASTVPRSVALLGRSYCCPAGKLSQLVVSKCSRHCQDGRPLHTTQTKLPRKHIC